MSGGTHGPEAGPGAPPRAARPPAPEPTVELACELVSRPSVTPRDEGCQALVAARLAPLGFRIRTLDRGAVANLWAERPGDGPRLLLLGHTDVVPPGPGELWRFPPFEPTRQDGFLFGRGTADMKGSLAAMVTACERFLARHPRPRGTLALLLTSDEEGPARDGVRQVAKLLRREGVRIDWCLVGEPTSEQTLGDTVKNGRRGSLNARLEIRGVQGHVAYPEQSVNPIHRACPALAELVREPWDEGSEHFPPSSLQISNIHAGTGAVNVVPGSLEARFNVRYSPRLTAPAIRARVEAILERHRLDYRIDWQHSGEPFLTEEGPLVEAALGAVRAVTGVTPRLSTSGGTSDGRFIAPLGAQVVELGPVNDTIHQIDERVRIDDLPALSRIYENVLERLLGA